jgi:creatinine amidohydrolase
MKRVLFISTLVIIAVTFVVLIKDAQAVAQNRMDGKTTSRQGVKFPTMLDMTFPEFEAAAKKTDVVLLPIGAIEEHGSHLPLGTDVIGATGQLFYVQKDLREKGFETILAPSLNIGITNESDDRARDGTYMYPGSLTIGKETFVRLYVDVLRSLHDNGMRRVFIFSGHLGGRHLEAIAQVVEEANRKIEGMNIYWLIESERFEQIKMKPTAHILIIEKGQNFEMLAQLLGTGAEKAFTTHADGEETSLTLYYQPDAVRSGYNLVPQSTSSRFIESVLSGDRTKNPSGSGGFPFQKASAAVGKKISDYRASSIAEIVLKVLQSK